MPNSRPASMMAVQRCSPKSAGQCSSQPVSPTKPTRIMRTGAASNYCLAVGHVGEGVGIEVGIGELQKKVAGAGPGDVDGGVGCGDVGDVDAAGTRSGPPLEPLLHEVRVAGAGGDVEVVGADAGDGAVVHDDTRVGADDAVTGAAYWRGWSGCWCRRWSRSLAASVPCTSSLPRVLTSMMPTRSRTARHSSSMVV